MFHLKINFRTPLIEGMDRRVIHGISQSEVLLEVGIPKR